MTNQTKAELLAEMEALKEQLGQQTSESTEEVPANVVTINTSHDAFKALVERVANKCRNMGFGVDLAPDSQWSKHVHSQIVFGKGLIAFTDPEGNKFIVDYKNNGSDEKSPASNLCGAVNGKLSGNTSTPTEASFASM